MRKFLLLLFISFNSEQFIQPFTGVYIVQASTIHILKLLNVSEESIKWKRKQSLLSAQIQWLGPTHRSNYRSFLLIYLHSILWSMPIIKSKSFTFRFSFATHNAQHKLRPFVFIFGINQTLLSQMQNGCEFCTIDGTIWLPARKSFFNRSLKDKRPDVWWLWQPEHFCQTMKLNAKKC